jgi:hypothetical protein
MSLIADAHWVLTKAWSVRFTVLAALLSGLEVVVPLLSNFIPHGPFAVLSFVSTVAAFFARFQAQQHQD